MPFPPEIKLLVQFRRDWRVSRVERATGPVRNRVEVRVGLGGELCLSSLDERRARGRVDLFFFFFFFFMLREIERSGSRLSFSFLSFSSASSSSPTPSRLFRASPTNSRSCWPQTDPGASRPAVI